MGDKTETVERPRIRMVCVGKTYIQSGKRGLVFKEVNADGAVGLERIYSEKDLKHVRVAAVYEVEVDQDNQRSIYPQSIRWLRLWPDTTEAAVWRTAADGFDTADLARRQEKKESGRSLPVELLEPLRKLYWKTNAANRLALEVRVLAYLRRVAIDED